MNKQDIDLSLSGSPLIRVYNIEDQDLVSDIFKKHFQDHEIEFYKLDHNHKSLEDIIESIESDFISLFLIDINLKSGESRLRGVPGTGMKYIELIKRKSELAYVVAYSSDDGYEEDCLKFGADIFLHKNNSIDGQWENSLNNVVVRFMDHCNGIINSKNQ